MAPSPYQRSLNSSSPLHPRNGAPKRTIDAPSVPGMKRQTAPSHEFLHGAPLQDEKEPPLKSPERAIPLHPSTTDKQRATVHPIANDPHAILTDAANLGKPQRA